jgi:TATA-box binding protein (TBP) (component of TFIID and TFIIIB)
MSEKPCKINNYKISFHTKLTDIVELIRAVEDHTSICKFYSNFVVIRKKFVYTVFFSGFCNVTKIKRKRHCQKAKTYFFTRVLQREDLEEKAGKIKINNITASGRFAHRIDLERARRELMIKGYTVGYKPDHFAGASVRLHKATVNLFHSGAYTIVGGKKKCHVKNTFRSITSLLQETNVIVENV